MARSGPVRWVTIASLVVIGLFAFTAVKLQAAVTFNTWQEMAVYVFQQTDKLNEHTAKIKVLEAENVALKADVAALAAWRVTTDKHVANIITAFDIKLYYDIALACDFNRQIPGWLTSLPGVKAIVIPTRLTCPPLPLNIYKPYYISTGGPLLPTP